MNHQPPPHRDISNGQALNMYSRDYNYNNNNNTSPNTKSSRKGVIRMDPDCAICHAPASHACECEAKGLEVAVRQAEARMMQSIYNDIRSVSPILSLSKVFIDILTLMVDHGFAHTHRTISSSTSDC